MQEIAIELLDARADGLSERLADDVTLRLADGTVVEGRDETMDHVARHVRRKFDLLKIEHAITHGRIGAASGVLTTGSKEAGFCVVVDFVNTRADRVQSIKFFGA